MKRGIIAAICLALCAPAAAQYGQKMGPDNVYVYHVGGNVSYQCTNAKAYFETEDFGSINMRDCQITSIDYAQWPIFQKQSTRVRLSGPAFKQEWAAQCQFVAHAMAMNRSTSTVIDCR